MEPDPPKPKKSDNPHPAWVQLDASGNVIPQKDLEEMMFRRHADAMDKEFEEEIAYDRAHPEHAKELPIHIAKAPTKTSRWVPHNVKPTKIETIIEKVVHHRPGDKMGYRITDQDWQEIMAERHEEDDGVEPQPEHVTDYPPQNEIDALVAQNPEIKENDQDVRVLSRATFDNTKKDLIDVQNAQKAILDMHMQTSKGGAGMLGVKYIFDLALGNLSIKLVNYVFDEAIKKSGKVMPRMKQLAKQIQANVASPEMITRYQFVLRVTKYGVTHLWPLLLGIGGVAIPVSLPLMGPILLPAIPSMLIIAGIIAVIVISVTVMLIAGTVAGWAVYKLYMKYVYKSLKAYIARRREIIARAQRSPAEQAGGQGETAVKTTLVGVDQSTSLVVGDQPTSVVAIPAQ